MTRAEKILAGGVEGLAAFAVRSSVIQCPPCKDCGGWPNSCEPCWLAYLNEMEDTP
jgi:hypothetical protein